MRILLFGENGQLARTLIEEARGAHEIIALGRTAADLMTAGTGAQAVEARQPEIVVNAAAYTAVDAAEPDEEAATQLNANAVGEIAGAAKAIGAHFIHVSTDYVFDGAQTNPLNETDATNPLNVYGATKLAGERAALDENDASIILRTSWVFSEFGGNFVKSMLRLGAEREALNVVSDQIGGPTPARDIARAILAIASKKHRGAAGDGVYHFQGAPIASWADFAVKIFEYAEMKTIINKIPTTEYPTPAERPRYTVLDCARIERDFGIAQPDWRIGLREVLSALKGAA